MRNGLRDRLERRVEFDQMFGHQTGGLERFAASRRRVAADTNSAITPSPMNLFEMAARLLDGAAHRGEITIEDKDDIVRQPCLGQPSEGAQIGKENGDLELAALQMAWSREAVARGSEGGQQRRYLDVTVGRS